MVKNGAGTQVLAGPNTYTGPTAVNNGASRVTGSLGSTSVTVGDQVAGHAAILSGTGTLGGNVTINGPGASGTAATIAAASGATLTIAGNLTLNDDSLSSFALTAAGVGNSGSPLINVLGTLTGPENTTHTLNFTGTAAAGTYDLFNYAASSVVAGQFTLGRRPGGSFTYNLAVSGTEIDLLVGNAGASSSWNFAGDGDYGDPTSGTAMSSPTAPARLPRSATVRPIPSPIHRPRPSTSPSMAPTPWAESCSTTRAPRCRRRTSSATAATPAPG